MRSEAANNLPGTVEKIIKAAFRAKPRRLRFPFQPGPTRIRKFVLQTL
jgi:hypothetical protein